MHLQIKKKSKSYKNIRRLFNWKSNLQHRHVISKLVKLTYVHLNIQNQIPKHILNTLFSTLTSPFNFWHKGQPINDLGSNYQLASFSQSNWKHFLNPLKLFDLYKVCEYICKKNPPKSLIAYCLWECSQPSNAHTKTFITNIPTMT